MQSLTITLEDARANPLGDIRLYGLRHTFTTLMFENSEQLKLVSEMLGHAPSRRLLLAALLRVALSPSFLKVFAPTLRFSMALILLLPLDAHQPVC